MKLFFPLTILLIVSSPQTLPQNTYSDYQEEHQQRVISATKANEKLSDDELMHYLERMLKYMPEEFEQLKSQTKSEIKRRLNNIRNFHSKNGLSISEIIKGFNEDPSAEELLAQIWAEDTLGYQYAESVLSGLSNEKYQTIVQSCEELMSFHEKTTYITDDFPESLSFLEIVTIAIKSSYCEIYLYLGVGSYKRAGFRVQRTADGLLRLEQFNYRVSLEHQIIDIDQ